MAWRCGLLLGVHAVLLFLVVEVNAGDRKFPAGLNLYCNQKSCYDILELPENAEKTDIKKAYRRLSLIHHPDKSNLPDADARFMEIATAYEVLSNDDKRKAYDDFLAHPERHIWEHYGAYYQAVYAPKSDVRIVLLGIIAACSAIHLFSAKHWRDRQRDNILSQQRTKLWIEKRVYELAGGKTLTGKKASEAEQKLYKEYQAQATEEVLTTTLVDGVNLTHDEDIGILDSLAGRIMCWPLDIVNWFVFHIRWIVVFQIMHRPYGEEERQYRTRRLLKMQDRQWRSLSPEERADLTARELWLPENWDVYQEEKKAEAEERQREFAQSTRYKQYKRMAKKYS